VTDVKSSAKSTWTRFSRFPSAALFAAVVAEQEGRSPTTFGRLDHPHGRHLEVRRRHCPPRGLTVDTSHTVVTPATAADALYVGMTRGRNANTAHVVTRAVPADAPPGAVLDSLHRSPTAVLAGVFETSDPQRSALAQAVDSAIEAESVRTPGELFADAAELATAGRTAKWLDQLVSDGRITTDQRIALAVEDGATTLTNLLRRVELAGQDPQQVLADAIDQRSLDDARQISNVLHTRIIERVNLDPIGDTFAEWTPKVDDPQWQEYLSTLARAADNRRGDLGRTVAADPPIWAVEALDPRPASDRPAEGIEWENSAASVAPYRELVGHDDEVDPLGQPPKPGQVESYAAWQSAWRALGRPEADRAEAEMSTGQLRVRIRAYEREKAWAPDYVADQLAGTRQAADKHRTDAALWGAQVSASAEDGNISRLCVDTADSAALAETLDERARQLAPIIRDHCVRIGVDQLKSAPGLGGWVLSKELSAEPKEHFLGEAYWLVCGVVGHR